MIRQLFDRVKSWFGVNPPKASLGKRSTSFDIPVPSFRKMGARVHRLHRRSPAWYAMCERAAKRHRALRDANNAAKSRCQQCGDHIPSSHLKTRQRSSTVVQIPSIFCGGNRCMQSTEVAHA